MSDRFLDYRDYNLDAYIPIQTMRQRVGDLVMRRVDRGRGFNFTGEDVHMSQVTVEVNNIEEVDETAYALRGVTFDVLAGEYIAIMGPSGSGKSTLLNVLGCLDRPTSGKYPRAGDDVAQINDYQLSRIRGQRIGFVFQSYNLLQQLNVVENIKVP